MQDGDDWIEENIWECNSCGQENLGRNMKCQNCGSPKEFDEQDKPITSTVANPVTDLKQLADANAGENWQCEYCMCQVRNSKGECQNCAAKRDEANSKMTEPVTPEEHQSEMRQLLRDRLPKDPPHRPTWQLYVAIGGGVLALFLLIALLWPNRIVSHVASTQWEYTLVVHQRQTNHGSGWGTPGGAFNTQCESRFKENVACHPYDCNPHQVSYDCNSRTYQCNPRSETYDCRCSSHKCNCHKECESLKNGYSRCHNECDSCRSCDTCSRTVYSTCEKHDTCYKTKYDTCYEQCPVYDNWCEYDYYSWPEKFRLKTQGDSWTTVGYYSFIEQSDQVYQYDHLENYTVTFRADDKKDTQTYTYHPKNLEDYKRFFNNKAWVLTKDLFGGTVTPQENK